MELDAILDNLSDEEQIELLELLEEEENYRNTHLLAVESSRYRKRRLSVSRSSVLITST